MCSAHQQFLWKFLKCIMYFSVLLTTLYSIQCKYYLMTWGHGSVDYELRYLTVCWTNELNGMHDGALPAPRSAPRMLSVGRWHRPGLLTRGLQAGPMTSSPGPGSQSTHTTSTASQNRRVIKHLQLNHPVLCEKKRLKQRHRVLDGTVS